MISNEPANVPWLVLDRSPSPASRALVQDVHATGYVLPPRAVASSREGEPLLALTLFAAMLALIRWRLEPRLA